MILVVAFHAPRVMRGAFSFPVGAFSQAALPRRPIISGYRK